ncbi:MAG: sensor histidine kinase [Candidatus Hodarchaeota archaeon]
MKSLSKKVLYLTAVLFSFTIVVLILVLVIIFLYIHEWLPNNVGMLLIFLISISVFIGAFFYMKFFLKRIFELERLSFFINLSIANFSLIISGITLVGLLYIPINKPGWFIWGILVPFCITILIVALVSIIYDLIQNLKLNELDNLKSMFIASTSHELRTPLTSIIGFTRMMLTGWVGEINEEQEKQLRIILKSANLLHKLIDDVIDVTKIEADKLDIRIEEFNLVKEILTLKETFNVAIEEKGLEFIIDMPEHLILFNDKKRIKQILVNLIGNAIKFTEKGVISIKIHKINGNAEISIKDTGIGIKKKDQEKLFKPFSRITESGKYEEGTGLGLHISKKLANLLGGDIFIESEFGKGSTFTLSLKLKREEISE